MTNGVSFVLSDTLSVLARTIGKDVFSPLAAECVQLGLNLTNAIDDPDLRRCTCVVNGCLCARYCHSLVEVLPTFLGWAFRVLFSELLIRLYIVQLSVFLSVGAGTACFRPCPQ